MRLRKFVSLQYKQTADYLLVYKPQGQPTTPGHMPNSLVEQVLLEFPEQSKVQGFKEGEGGLLYRLDTDTSGLVLFALTNEAFSQFTHAVQKNKIQKYYEALVKGHIYPEQATIDFSIAHHPQNQAKMVVAKHGNENKRSQWREVETNYELIKYVGENSLIRVAITKGARHQIRVHFNAIGHPLCSDPLYGLHDIKEPAFFLECTQVIWPEKHLEFSFITNH